MLGSDLAELYGVATKVLMQAVRRNLDRFPSDFLFRLNEQDLSVLRSQIVTLENEPGPTDGRAFVRLRDLIGHNRELAQRLDLLEAKYDKQFKVVFDAIRELTPAPAPKRKIGFIQNQSTAADVEGHKL